MGVWKQKRKWVINHVEIAKSSRDGKYKIFLWIDLYAIFAIENLSEFSQKYIENLIELQFKIYSRSVQFTDAEGINSNFFYNIPHWIKWQKMIGKYKL